MKFSPMYGKQEALDIVRRFRLIATIAIAYLAVGTVFYRFQEGFSWVDALYFSTVSCLTVGYGDLTPKTTFGKLFTVFYLIGGVGILAAFASNVFKTIIAKRHIKFDEFTDKDESN